MYVPTCLHAYPQVSTHVQRLMSEVFLNPSAPYLLRQRLLLLHLVCEVSLLLGFRLCLLCPGITVAATPAPILQWS